MVIVKAVAKNTLGKLYWLVLRVRLLYSIPYSLIQRPTEVRLTTWAIVLSLIHASDLLSIW
jgi:hypothetical protein